MVRLVCVREIRERENEEGEGGGGGGGGGGGVKVYSCIATSLAMYVCTACT